MVARRPRRYAKIHTGAQREHNLRKNSHGTIARAIRHAIPAEGRVRQESSFLYRKYNKKNTVFAPRPSRSSQRVARARQNRKNTLSFLHIDADPRRGSRAHSKNRKKRNRVFARQPRRSLRGSHFRRVCLVPPRRFKIPALRKRASLSYARARRNARSLHNSLCTFPLRASMHFTIYFPCACLYALHCLLSLHTPLRISLSAFLVRTSMHLCQYLPYACLYAFDGLLSLCMHLCISLCTCPMHASLHFTVYFPCACMYAFHSVLALCISLCTFPTHAFMHFTAYFPYAVKLCRMQRLYRKNLSQCFREKWNNPLIVTCSFFSTRRLGSPEWRKGIKNKANNAPNPFLISAHVQIQCPSSAISQTLANTKTSAHIVFALTNAKLSAKRTNFPKRNLFHTKPPKKHAKYRSVLRCFQHPGVGVDFID